MKSPHLLNPGSLTKAVKQGYPAMLRAYDYYGSGKPTEGMLKFYQKAHDRLRSGLTSDFDNRSRDKKLREYQCLIQLITLILTHPEHRDRGSVRDVYTQLAEPV